MENGSNENKNHNTRQKIPQKLEKMKNVAENMEKSKLLKRTTVCCQLKEDKEAKERNMGSKEKEEKWSTKF